MKTFINGKPESEFIYSQIISANGAITIKEGVVFVTKTSACAMTIANPTAGTDDSKRLVIIPITNFAHTITNTSGFNNEGALTDGYTMAILETRMSFAIRAYNGRWYIENYDFNASIG